MVRLNGSESGAVEVVAPSGDTTERRSVSTERLVLLRNSTLHSFKLMSTGQGFDVHLTVPLEEAGKLEELTAALHRVVDVHVVQFSRRARREGSAYDWTAAYEGVDDE